MCGKIGREWPIVESVDHWGNYNYADLHHIVPKNKHETSSRVGLGTDKR